MSTQIHLPSDRNTIHIHFDQPKRHFLITSGVNLVTIANFFVQDILGFSIFTN
uniref:Uncharacterized protein n=1 Tax=Rhizophora mucronata TaxID=61149 RepID=A0A2P2JIU3_RHIMU